MPTMRREQRRQQRRLALSRRLPACNSMGGSRSPAWPRCADEARSILLASSLTQVLWPEFTTSASHCSARETGCPSNLAVMTIAGRPGRSKPDGCPPPPASHPRRSAASTSADYYRKPDIEVDELSLGDQGVSSERHSDRRMRMVYHRAGCQPEPVSADSDIAAHLRRGRKRALQRRMSL